MTELPQEREPVAVRHDQVRDETVGLEGFGIGPKSASRGIGPHVVTLARQQQLERPAYAGIVLHDDDPAPPRGRLAKRVHGLAMPDEQGGVSR